MKIRLGNLLNGLNITLDTAKERLKKSGKMDAGKTYTLNSVVSEEDIKILSTYSQNIGHKQNPKSSKKKKKPNANKKALRPTDSEIDPMSEGRRFDSCPSYFIGNQNQIDAFENIMDELKRIFGDDVSLSKLPLLKVEVIKGSNVNYKYYYFARSGRKVLVRHRCVATWLACIFSKAVKQKKLLKADYMKIFNSYLWKPIQSVKIKPVKPHKKRPWVSVVSVPFGGMSRR